MFIGFGLGEVAGSVSADTLAGIGRGAASEYSTDSSARIVGCMTPKSGISPGPSLCSTFTSLFGSSAIWEDTALVGVSARGSFGM